MKQELVSDIMPTYNASKYHAESIESALAQTYTNLELLITDDGNYMFGRCSKLVGGSGNRME